MMAALSVLPDDIVARLFTFSKCSYFNETCKLYASSGGIYLPKKYIFF